MGVTIKELNEKYTKEDSLWDFSLFDEWLSKKGIEQDVIDTTLKQTLLEFSADTLPKDHFTFDNTVLLRALLNKQVLRKERHALLEKEAYGDWYKISKLKRIWLVIIGKD
jgi:hypothetical protein